MDFYQNSDSEFTATQSSNAVPGGLFDDVLSGPSAGQGGLNGASSFLSPGDGSFKQLCHPEFTQGASQLHHTQSSSLSASPDNSSHSSSSNSPHHHNRNISTTSENSNSYGGAILMPNSDTPMGSMEWTSPDGLNNVDDPLHLDLDSSFPAMDGPAPLSMETDLETSNEAMNSTFDFDSAASSPSPFGTRIAPLSSARSNPMTMAFHNGPKVTNSLAQTKNASPRLPAPFLFQGSQESSPLSTMLPKQGQSPNALWNNNNNNKPSPSYGLENTFENITMNGDSPQNESLSPNLNFGTNGFSFDTSDSSATPSTFTKDISSPPSTINSNSDNGVTPRLSVYHPTSKSRVETQIQVKLTLYPLPAGASKLRLPTHTVSKPKFLAKPESETASDILELSTSLVCTSAMQDPQKLQRAYARARGENVGRLPGSSPQSASGSQSPKEEEEKPLDGGEVKICAGCIQRERKRASRKKSRKPDEDELFQKDEEKRVVVFNTNEIKEWVEPSKIPQAPLNEAPLPPSPPGSMQVELPMRIACYCRHQNEKIGFQVIFTIKDSNGKLVAQSISSSIMITDDHKTHAPPPPPPPVTTALPDVSQVPGTAVFHSGPGLDVPPSRSMGPSLQRQAHSTTDLPAYGQQHFNMPYAMTPQSNPFSTSNSTSATLTPRNLSRQPSPTGLQGPSTKRRKQSGSGKVHARLMMTALDTSQPQAGPSTAPTTAGTSPFGANMQALLRSADRPFAMPISRPGQFSTSPPTPSSNENGIFTNAQRSQSMENLAAQQYLSAPNSAHPSRPGSPGGNLRNSYHESNPNLAQAVANQLYGVSANSSHRPPPTIHKLVPAEGSTIGGTEVTLLGSGFYQGLEVVFGDSLATTTTYWAEKALHCLTPPAIQPGMVAVVFKHEHPSFGPIQQQSHMPKQHSFFKYIDDNELQLYRLALGIVGEQKFGSSDSYAAAKTLLDNQQYGWNMQGTGFNPGGSRQNQYSNFKSSQQDTPDLELGLLKCLDLLDLDDAFQRARLNIKQSTGHTMLHFASSLGLTRFVTALLKKGANPNIPDNNGNTPMHVAALRGHAHIVHRLRLAGANQTARSIRNFTPADLAISLAAHQAAIFPVHHYRSRSAGSTPLRINSRNSSQISLTSFMESATNASYGYSEGSLDDSQDDVESETSGPNQAAGTIYYYTPSRRPSGQLEKPQGPYYLTTSRRGSSQQDRIQTSATLPHPGEDGRGVISPAAAMMAWRDQLAAQIHQFQQSVNWALPHLPALPPIPALPDYQAYPMVRRISSLVPHRPTGLRSSASSSGAKDGDYRWWELLTGTSSSPPAYEDLYPNQGHTADDFSMKKSSAMLAAADAALDQHFETSTPQASSSSPIEEIGDVRIGRKSISREQQEQLRMAHARKVKKIQSDRNLFFIWIPLLIFVLVAMLKNLVPEVWQGASQGYEFLKTYYNDGVVEVA